VLVLDWRSMVVLVLVLALLTASPPFQGSGLSELPKE
jgi:hypothetical protein